MNRLDVDCTNSAKSPIDGESSGAVGPNKRVKRTSRLALASIVFLGIATVCYYIELGFAAADLLGFFPEFNLGVFSALAIGFLLVAFALGIIACVVIGLDKKLKGYVYTIAPICLGSLFILSMGFICLHAQYRAIRDKTTRPTYNLRQLGRAISRYAEDHDGYLPAASKWCDLLMEYDPNLSKSSFKHPLIKDWDCNFAFNKNLDGLRLDDIPGDVVLLFEADGDWNLDGGPKLLETRRTEHGYIKVLFADQTIRNYWFDKEAVTFINKDLSFTDKPLRWEP